MSPRLRRLELAIFPFAIIGAVQLAVWLDYRQPVRILFRVITDLSIVPGGVFSYDRYFVRDRICEAHVKRWLVGSDNVIRDIVDGKIVQEYMPLHVSVIVPRSMPPGISQACFQNSWTCSPIQRLWPINGPETCLDFLVTSPRSP